LAPLAACKLRYAAGIRKVNAQRFGSLLEAIFGHEKGAFYGSQRGEAGSRGDGSSRPAFLDELPISIWAARASFCTFSQEVFLQIGIRANIR